MLWVVVRVEEEEEDGVNEKERINGLDSCFD